MSANGVVGSRDPRDRMETTEGRACRPATALPPLRFRGYDEAWEGKKLGDMFSLREERNTDGGMTEILSVVKDVGVILYSEKGNVGNRAKDDVRQYNIARKNDIVLNSMNVIIGSVGVSRYDGCISPAYYAISPKDSTSSDFWGYWFWRPMTQGLIASRACGLMEIRRKISTEDLLDLDVFSSLKREQQEVGTLLSDLDVLIAGRWQGLEKLRNLKKAMLEKMFPRAGAKVPEVRFKGFEGEWEKKRLGDLVFRVTRKNSNLESDLPLTVSAERGLVDQRTFFNSRIASKNVSNYFLLKKGEFAYNKSSSDGYPYGTVKRLDLYPMGVLSTLYIVFAINSQDVDSEYLVHFYSTKLWHYDVSLRAAEGARNHGLLNIAPSDFFETSIILPRDISEQQRVGAYFRSLDSLIVARREEVGKLKDLKKALLDRMFV